MVARRWGVLPVHLAHSKEQDHTPILTSNLQGRPNAPTGDASQCHPERSEGLSCKESRCFAAAQHDRVDPTIAIPGCHPEHIRSTQCKLREGSVEP
jgi:hypothetical protein